MAQMVRRMVAAVLGLGLLAAGLWPSAALARPLALTISRVTVTNVTDVAFTVIWVTNERATGWVNYGTSQGSLGSRADDVRGASTAAYTHYVRVNVPSAGTTYYFRVTSGTVAVDQDSSGNPLQARTGPTLSALPFPNPLAGRVLKSDGATPAEGAIVYAWLRDANSRGTSGESAKVSVLTSRDGSFALDVGARTPDLQAYFDYSQSGDTIVVQADGGPQGTIVRAVDTSTTVNGSNPTNVSLTLPAAEPSQPTPTSPPQATAAQPTQPTQTPPTQSTPTATRQPGAPTATTPPGATATKVSLTTPSATIAPSSSTELTPTPTLSSTESEETPIATLPPAPTRAGESSGSPAPTAPPAEANSAPETQPTPTAARALVLATAPTSSRAGTPVPTVRPGSTAAAGARQTALPSNAGEAWASPTPTSAGSAEDGIPGDITTILAVALATIAAGLGTVTYGLVSDRGRRQR